jgi:actin-like ATPase involved in cell morphogenesis
MAGQVFGLDFGTTNSLLSIIGQDGDPIHLTDDRDRPHPSVIWYRGSEVVVGRNARENLDSGTEAITGAFVRSPKRLLDHDAPIHVAGRDVDPRDVISEVLKFLRADATSGQTVSYSPDRAVMTIPVRLDGAGRRRLREAARKAGIGVVQFVHEPLAALYSYLRSQQDYRRRLAELDGCRVLVFDWGGGTLDLTLCQVQRDQIVQIANLGDDDVGGDRFDELVRNQVRDAHAGQHGIQDLAGLERDEARILLLNQCELRKIELSQRETATVFVRNYLRREGAGRDLSVRVSRSELASWTRDLTARGLEAIDSLLEQNHLSHQQIALCLPTGGMVNMPAIRDGLSERFGARAPRISNGDRIISEGAAWIAHDELRLGLAKPIELLQSDNSYAPIVPIPFLLPVENEVSSASKGTYYCVDPRSGRASFTFARPARPRAKDARSDRQAYATLHLEIDETASPFMERLELDLKIDHDYVARVDLQSSMRKHHLQTEIFDLEFTLRFPMLAEGVVKSKAEDGEDVELQGNATTVNGQSVNLGAVRLRSNIAADASWEMVPGDLVVQYDSHWFDERSQRYSDWQKAEWVYYKDCPYCHRSRYEFRSQGCDDQRCLWRRVFPKVELVGSGQTKTTGSTR